jgi:hypothetical protein
MSFIRAERVYDPDDPNADDLLCLLTERKVVCKYNSFHFTDNFRGQVL